MTKITAWSYSRLALYESCPLQYKFRNIDKLYEPPNEAMANGIKVHDEGAKYLEDKTDIVPKSYTLFADQMRELKALKPMVEQRWTFTANWGSVSWFHKKAWLRVILDAGVQYKDGDMDIIDHKTGKFHGEAIPRPDGSIEYVVDEDSEYADQMALFAATAFKKDPYNVRHVTTRLWYLDEGIEVIMEFDKEKAFKRLKELEKRANVLLNATRFPPRPSWKCKWCHWRNSNGGECKHG